MIATSHVIIGGAAALATSVITKNPAAALAVGVAAHLICDCLPHLDTPPNVKFRDDGEVIWDKSLYIFAIIDSLVGFFAVLSIWWFRDHWSIFSVFAWGAFGGYLPDFLDNFPFWRDQIHSLPLFKQFHQFHKIIHNNWLKFYPMPRYWMLGILTQIIVIVPSLWFLLK
jgi:hypothetical protein